MLDVQREIKGDEKEDMNKMRSSDKKTKGQQE